MGVGQPRGRPAPLRRGAGLRPGGRPSRGRGPELRAGLLRLDAGAPRRAYRRLYSFGDDSSNYLWKLHAAAEIMRLYRKDPAELVGLAALQTAKNSAEEVLHPPASTDRARESRRRSRRPGRPAGSRSSRRKPAVTGLDPRHADGRAGRASRRPARPLPRLRPEALAMTLYIGAQTRAIERRRAARGHVHRARPGLPAPAGAPQPRGDRELLAATTGWTFDVSRTYRSRSAGAGVPVRAGPPPGARRHRLGARARRDPRHRRRTTRRPCWDCSTGSANAKPRRCLGLHDLLDRVGGGRARRGPGLVGGPRGAVGGRHDLVGLERRGPARPGPGAAAARRASSSARATRHVDLDAGTFSAETIASATCSGVWSLNPR